MTKTPNFTAEQEQMIRDAAPLNAAIAAALGEKMGKSQKSITAKALRMGVAYVRKTAVSKTGAPVEKKETIVAQISDLVDANLDGLDKAPKLALQRLRDHLIAVAG